MTANGTPSSGDSLAFPASLHPVRIVSWGALALKSLHKRTHLEIFQAAFAACVQIRGHQSSHSHVSIGVQIV